MQAVLFICKCGGIIGSKLSLDDSRLKRAQPGFTVSKCPLKSNIACRHSVLILHHFPPLSTQTSLTKNVLTDPRWRNFASHYSQCERKEQSKGRKKHQDIIKMAIFDRWAHFLSHFRLSKRHIALRIQYPSMLFWGRHLLCLHTKETQMSCDRVKDSLHNLWVLQQTSKWTFQSNQPRKIRITVYLT